MPSYDARMVPARPDLAARHLEGTVDAARFVDGVVREVVLHEVGHGPLIERPDEVARLMLEHIDGH